MSIKKIAEKAGISPSTVSRILNNPNYKSSTPGLRDKVWKIAMELDYAPNEAARNLRVGGQKNTAETLYINVLMTNTDAMQTDPFFTELLHIIESEIHRQMCILSQVWHMPVLSSEKRCRRENLEQIIGTMYESMEHPCDGLLVIGKCTKNALRKLKEKFRNVVSVNRNSTNFEVDEVLCDGTKIAEMAVEYLIGLGHKDIGYIGACHNEMRYTGFRRTLEKHGLEIIPEYIVETNQTEVEGYEAMKKLLQERISPSGIYCANDITAIGVLKCLGSSKRRRYSPSVIASDDIYEAQYSKPMLTTVGLPKAEMGKFAVYLMLDRIRGGHDSIVKLELEGRLVIRQSCTPAEDCEWCEYYI